MPAPASIRLLIADDHAVVRVGLVSMLANETDIEVVAEAENGLQAVSLFLKFRPDVALFDVRMPEMDGIAALRLVRADFPAACILMISSAELDEEVAVAAEAGATGYITKSTSPASMAAAIRGAAAGTPQFSRGTAQRIDSRQHLSPREREVLTAMARGQSNKQIAAALHLSEHTVKTHVKAILAKLKSEDRAGAVASGFTRGILKIP